RTARARSARSSLVPGAAQREPGAGRHRLDRRDLLRGSARPGARVRRRRRRARAGAIAARRAPRLARLAALSAAAPRAAGIRPDMTPTYDGHAESSGTIDLPAPTAW